MKKEESSLNKADEVLHKIEEAAKKDFMPIIGPNRGLILSDEVSKAKPQRVLEVGTLIGYSTILIGKELSKTSEVVSIEIHGDEAELAKENIANAKLKPKVTVITGDARKMIPTLQGSFGFVFIDAEKTEYLQYLCLAENKMGKHAVVFADNAGIFADQMKDYLDYVRSTGKYQSRYLQVGDDGVEISVKL